MPPFETYLSILSLCVGLISLIISVGFFIAAKQTEKENIQLLANINERVETLKTINNNLLGTAIHHLATTSTQLIEKAFHPHQENTEVVSEYLKQEKFGTNDIVKLIALYFYAARTNYFAKLTKQAIPLTDKTKSIHIIADDAIIKSHVDFKTISEEFDKIDKSTLKEHHLYKFYEEIETYWKPNITDKI